MLTPSTRMAELMARVGFDAVLFDTQHGECGHSEARDGIAAVRMVGKPTVVRLSIDGQAEGARMLDSGMFLLILLVLIL